MNINGNLMKRKVSLIKHNICHLFYLFYHLIMENGDIENGNQVISSISNRIQYISPSEILGHTIFIDIMESLIQCSTQ